MRICHSILFDYGGHLARAMRDHARARGKGSKVKIDPGWLRRVILGKSTLATAGVTTGLEIP